MLFDMKSTIYTFLFLGTFLFISCESEKKPSFFERIADAVEEAEEREEEALNKEYSLDPDNSILATDLVHAYEGNQLRADAKFRDSIFTVRGKIEEIGRDFEDNPVVDLRGGGLFEIVQCYFVDASELTHYNVGDKVRITGRCNGKSIFVEMQECTHIELIP